MSKVKITKEKFLAYEACRESGKTNMLDFPIVVSMTGLSVKEITEIIDNYHMYNNKFNSGK